MYTSTPLSLLPFSLQHFLLLPSFLQASPPVFAPLFPLIILQMFHPLSFYHPHLSLSPHTSVTFISIFCLFPPFSILLRCFFLSLLPPLWSLSISPFSTSTLPSSLEILYPLLPPFLLSSNLCTLFPTSLPLSSQSILISPVLSLLLSPPIHCLFPPLLSFSLPPLSFDTNPTRKIYLFHFSLSRPQLYPH